MFPQTGRSNCG